MNPPFSDDERKRLVELDNRSTSATVWNDLADFTDRLLAAYLRANPDKRPSTTTALDLVAFARAKASAER